MYGDLFSQLIHKRTRGFLIKNSMEGFNGFLLLLFQLRGICSAKCPVYGDLFSQLIHKRTRGFLIKNSMEGFNGTYSLL